VSPLRSSDARSPSSSGCPKEEELSRFPVRRFVSAPSLADARQRAHVQGAPAEAVRLLVDSADARVCAQMMARIEQRMRAERADRSRVRPVFYEAGGYYYAVLTLRPHRSAPPGLVHIDGRWMPMYVFDSALNLLQVVAV
jgi:hypothetical protein